MIDAFDHLRTGTEIMAEQHLSALPRLGVFGGCVGFVLFKENPRVCQPELIDRLLYIAYQFCFSQLSAVKIASCTPLES